MKEHGSVKADFNNMCYLRAFLCLTVSLLPAAVLSFSTGSTDQQERTGNVSRNPEKTLVMQQKTVLSEAAKARFLLSLITEVQANGSRVFSAKRAETLVQPAAPSVDTASMNETLELQARKLSDAANRARSAICTLVEGKNHKDVDIDSLASVLEDLKATDAKLYIETYNLISPMIDETTKQVMLEVLANASFREGEFDIRELLSSYAEPIIASMKGRCASTPSIRSAWGTEIETWSIK